MPYIPEDDRERVMTDGPSKAGDFNYIITAAMNEILVDEGVSYDSIHRLVGELECAKLELYRRLLGPREDDKIEENGDVYTV